MYKLILSPYLSTEPIQTEIFFPPYSYFKVSSFSLKMKYNT